jgi:DNA-binding transcriptional LysR family regulator
MEVSTRQLRAFRLVAQHRNFTRAAEALFITPSGLSVLIRELEGRVGFRLFDRTTRHVELTAHGRELLSVIQRNLEELDAAIANIGRSAKRNQQSIILGTTPLVAANILPPAMREFHKQRPDVRIQLFDADLPTLINMVEAGKLDMSLGTRPTAPLMMGVSGQARVYRPISGRTHRQGAEVHGRESRASSADHWNRRRSGVGATATDGPPSAVERVGTGVLRSAQYPQGVARRRCRRPDGTCRTRRARTPDLHGRCASKVSAWRASIAPSLAGVLRGTTGVSASNSSDHS